MGNILYTYYEIDVSDIWAYEQEQFMEGKSSREHAQKLLDLAQQYIIKKAIPLFGNSMSDNGTDSDKVYYSGKIVEYHKSLPSLEDLYRIDYFFHKYDCYDYNHEVILKFKDQDFPFFFLLKLRQYDENLFELNNFLKFQLRKSFNNNATRFTDFLTIVLLDRDGFLNENIKTLINKFINEMLERQELIKTEKTIVKDKSPRKKAPESIKQPPTVWQLALYYVYIISSNEHKSIDQIAKTRKDAFTILAAKNEISAKSFEQHFDFYYKAGNRNGKLNSEKRTIKTIMIDIQFVIDNMLSKSPKALAIAQSDLDQIKMKP
jgi:hypothetical protein